MPTRLSPEEIARRRAILTKVRARGGKRDEAAAEIGIAPENLTKFMMRYARDLRWKRGRPPVLHPGDKEHGRR